MNRNWEMIDKVAEGLGWETLTRELCLYFSSVEINKAIENIANTWDIPTEEKE